MPSVEQHCQIDKTHGLEPHPDVHTLLDQFAHYPDMVFLRRHRKFLHHAEGIDYVRRRYGDAAGESAMLHVMADCGWVPNAVDYYNGNASEFGERNLHR